MDDATFCLVVCFQAVNGACRIQCLLQFIQEHFHLLHVWLARSCMCRVQLLGFTGHSDCSLWTRLGTKAMLVCDLPTLCVVFAVL